jgi:hypothetical protein
LQLSGIKNKELEQHLKEKQILVKKLDEEFCDD